MNETKNYDYQLSEMLKYMEEHLAQDKPLLTEFNRLHMRVMLDDGAILPTRAHDTDAGLDLYARENMIVPAHGYATFDTGVHIELPKNTYGKIESKSGLNVKESIVSCGGVIDEPYTGSIVVKLYNFGDADYEFKKGQKVAQLIVQPCLYVVLEETKTWNRKTDRGESGFGSTGV